VGDGEGKVNSGARGGVVRASRWGIIVPGCVIFCEDGVAKGEVKVRGAEALAVGEESVDPWGVE
jgi:hypothetical protein